MSQVSQVTCTISCISLQEKGEFVIMGKGSGENGKVEPRSKAFVYVLGEVHIL